MERHETSLSIDEVNQRLPLVSAIVRDIVDLFGDVSQRQARLGDLRESYPAGERDDDYREEVVQMEQELDRDRRQLDAFAQELEQVGGVLTNAMTGTVDFASLQSGDRVSLCWKLGEPEVMFWHSGECGESRIPLDPQSAGLTIESSFACGDDSDEDA